MSARAAQAAVGFRVHTGWAAMVAVTGTAASPTVVDRRRVEMIAGHEPDAPPFVYHAAAKLPIAAAERFVQEHAHAARAHARAAVEDAVGALRERGYQAVASGVIVGNRPFAAPLEDILKAHSLIHAAEGELFRQAIIDASEACDLRVTRIPAREIRDRSVAQRQLVISVGRAAGRPWAQDQKESFLAALLALLARSI
jgi:hypothetical protein